MMAWQMAGAGYVQGGVQQTIQKPMAAPTKGKGKAPPEIGTGEVRFENALSCQTALQTMNGSVLAGQQIYVSFDPNSKDGTRIIVTGLAPAVEWQELKDHFSTVGQVAFANITSSPASVVAASMQWQHVPPSMMPSPRAVGEVRFDDPMDAPRALAQFNGAEVAGNRLLVERAPMSQDGAKILVRNLPPGFRWQELKDLFGHIGSVAFVDIKM